MRALLVVVVVLAQAGTPPAVTTGAPANVTQTTATVTGTVDPSGAETTYHFDYGTSTAVRADDGRPDRERRPGGGADELSGLTSDTTYHYRLVATNAAGMTRGADRTLHTQPPPANPRPPGVRPAECAPSAPTGRR